MEGVGIAAGKILEYAGKIVGRTKIGSATGKVFNQMGSRINTVRQGIQSFESKALQRLNPFNYELKMGTKGLTLGSGPADFSLKFKPKGGGFSDVALGKGKFLQDFAESPRVNAKSYKEWFKSGLADEPVGLENFGVPFESATSRTSKIKFNLEDVSIESARALDKSLASSIDPVRHPLIGGKDLVTEWELRRILGNRKLFKKTEFYYGDSTKFSAAEVESMGITPMY